MPPRVTVVIPNWNGKRFLRLCLGSLQDQSFRDFETILVDNGSIDGSISFVEEHFPGVEVVPLGENRGIAAAFNAGIGVSTAEYVALLNNDTEQDPGWLGASVRAAEDHPESGLFASRLVDFHDRGVLDGAGDAMRLSGLPYRLGHGERDSAGSTRRATYLGRVRRRRSTAGICSMRSGSSTRTSSLTARMGT